MHPTPTISHREFWSLPEVKRIQRIQQTNPPSSKEWQQAEEALLLIAAQYNAVHFFL